MKKRLTFVAALLLVAAGAVVVFRGIHRKSIRIRVKVEEPRGYPDDPSPLAGALRQDLTVLDLHPKGEGRYDVSIGSESSSSPLLSNVDLRPFVPRVPLLARGNATLTRIALIQRELNRHETRYGPSAGNDDVRIANNCLRQGLWEVILAKKTPSGLATDYHCWFNFPKEDYARIFEQVNDVRYADYEKLLVEYPEIGGFPVPLEALRTIEHEMDAGPIETHAAEAVQRFPEQERKAKLVLTKGVKTFADFVASANQPITTAKFSEPGFYNAADPTKFDLSWLASPTKLTCRKARNPKLKASFDEIEVRFANGTRMLLGGVDLAALPARSEPPKTEEDVLRVTFGIGTPDIYASATNRAREFDEDHNEYLFLIDEKGNHLDNHAGGLDRVYLWREAGAPGALHLLLVGYERIALVGHLSVPWSPCREA